jgi:hypothetical protein
MDESAPVVTASVAPTTSPRGETTSPLPAWAYRFAVAVAVLPIVVAAVRALADGWYAVSDDALFPLRALDVFTSHPPLLGTWSSASGSTGINVNHPGPLLFYLFALPVRVFGPSAGTVLGTASLNALSVLAVAWLARRRGGDVFAVATMATVAGLEWAMGGPTLFDPWNPHAATLPWCAVLFAAWSVLDGDWVAAPVLVFAGSLALQLHLSYVVQVPLVVGVVVVGAIALRRWAAVRAPRTRLGSGSWRWLAGAGVLGVVLWLPPLWQQVTGHPGNLTALLHARQHVTPPPIGLVDGARTVSTVVALPPWFLPSGWDRPTFATVRLGQDLGFRWGTAPALIGLAVVVLVLAAAFARGARRRDRTTVAGAGLALAVLGGALVTAANASSPFFSIESYVRWLWPLSLFCWLLIGRAVVGFVADRWPTVRARARAARLPVAALALATGASVVGAIGAFGGSDRGSGAIPWARSSSKAITGQAVRALQDRGPVLLHERLDVGGYAVVPSIQVELERHGVRYYVDDIAESHQLGGFRLYRGQPTTTTVWFASGDAALFTPDGATRVGFHKGLAPEDEATMRGLKERLVAQLSRTGLRITPHGERLLALPRYRFTKVLVDRVRATPADLASGLTIQSLLLNDMVASTDPAYPLLVDYDAYARRWDLETVAMFAAPTGSPAAPLPNQYPLPKGDQW